MPMISDGGSTLPSQCEVAIIGAGPVGLMAANLLGAAGVDTVVLERAADLLGIPRAIAYDPETLRLFDAVGLLEAIEPGLVRDPGVVYFNARGRRLMEISPPKSPFGYSQLGTFHQPSFERALLGGLGRFDNVRVAFRHEATGLELSQDDVALTLSAPGGARALRARYVIACDGGSSPTRERLGVKAVGSTYLERWLVVDARVENHGVEKITFRCDPRRPIVELPAVGSRVRWEFMQMPGEDPQTLSRDETVAALLAPLLKGNRYEIERKTVYAFHARVAERWREGRVFLAGDAAHLMPPFAGQGMNSGMKDVANLSWKLAATLAGRADDSILDSYETERADNVRETVKVSRRLGALIMPTRRSIAALRDALFACLNLSSGFRAFARRGGLLPPPLIGRSAMTGRGRDRLIGAMMPQPELVVDGVCARLDRWLGFQQWLVIGVGVDPLAELSPRDRAILDRLGAKYLAVNHAGGDPKTLAARCDDVDFLAWARRHRVRALLVRPDRFIAERPRHRRVLRSLDLFERATVAATAPGRDIATAPVR